MPCHNTAPSTSLLTEFYELVGRDVETTCQTGNTGQFEHLAGEVLHDVGQVKGSADDDQKKRKNPTDCQEKEITTAVNGKKKQNASRGRDRERRQRVMRDLFRRKVIALAERWMCYMRVTGSAAKQDVVVNDEQRYDTGAPSSSAVHNTDDRSDDLFRKQNGYFYYNILCTSDLERLVSNAAARDGKTQRDDRLIIKLAYAADIYLRVMYNADVRPSVFIKFDDRGSPFLFARQTRRAPDTCVTGPPGQYWSKTLHLDSPVRTSQHVALQRVRSGRLIQDSTFVVLGEGALENMPDCFASPSLRYRKLFKEVYRYIASVPEIDLSAFGWETVKNYGILDPIKTFLPRVYDTENRPADDALFVNYVDMFVTMVTNMLQMEQSGVPRRTKIYRTEYKFELLGRDDSPDVHFYRNADDYITDVCMVNGADSLLDEEEVATRITAADANDDGVYFYDVKLVKDVEMKLDDGPPPQSEDFYKFVLSECDDVKEMLAFSKNTVDRKLSDALHDDLYIRLHETDAAVRQNPASCLEAHLDRVYVKTDMSQYSTSYYIYKSTKIRRVLNEPPRCLESGDCVLRTYRLKWNGEQDGKYVYTMYPSFAVVFKRLSVYEIVNCRDPTWKACGTFAFPQRPVDSAFRCNDDDDTAGTTQSKNFTAVEEKTSALNSHEESIFSLIASAEFNIPML